MKISKILLLFAMILCVGCIDPAPESGGDKKQEWNTSGEIVGDWELTEWNSSTEIDMRVYIRFNEDSTFDLYQRIYSAIWVHYTGTFTLSNSVLKGVYSDGVAWSADYNIAYSNEPKRIRLTNVENSADMAIYTSNAIPENVIEDCTEATNVRSVTLERFL